MLDSWVDEVYESAHWLCSLFRQSCLVVSLVVSLGIHIVGGVARSLDRTTSHTQKHKSFRRGRRRARLSPEKRQKNAFSSEGALDLRISP